MWNRMKLAPIGKCRIVLQNPPNMKKYSVEFTLVKKSLTPFLRKRTSEHMDLITVHYDKC